MQGYPSKQKDYEVSMKNGFLLPLVFKNTGPFKFLEGNIFFFSLHLQLLDITQNSLKNTFLGGPTSTDKMLRKKNTLHPPIFV